MRYTSRDFGKTKSEFELEVPEKLVHRQLEHTAIAQEFSAQRKHAVFVADLPSRTLSLTVGHLEPGQTTSRHRHSYETIIYVLEGEGYTLIEGERVEWATGDAVYIPVWAWHQHSNASKTRLCRYVACENAPLMQNLGAAVREEGG